MNSKVKVNGKAEALKRIDQKLAQVRGAVQAPKRPEAGPASAVAPKGFRVGSNSEAGGGGKLAGLDTATGQEVRAAPDGARARAPSSVVRLANSGLSQFPKSISRLPHTMVNLTGKSGVQVASIPHVYHPSAESVGVAIAHTLAHGGASEHESMDVKRGRVVRSVGRLYLDEVSTGASNNAVGCNLGIYPIAPTAFGERLEMLANMFEQNKVHRLIVEYHPSVAATQAGSLAMFARNDTTAPLNVIGTDLIRHAATHASFKEFQVWQRADMAIQPNDVMKSYFDSGSGETRMILQGELQIMTSAALATLSSYGNLYVVYDIEFFSEELDLDEAEVPAGSTAISFQAATWNTDNAFEVALGPNVGVGVPFVTMDLSSMQFESDYIIYGVVTDNLFPGGLLLYTHEDDGPSQLAPGMGFVAFIRSGPQGSTTDWTSRAYFQWSFGTGSGEQVWYYASTNAVPATGLIHVKIRGVKQLSG